METLQFKTNIKCGGCVAKVTSVLNTTAGTDAWKVDTENPEKILTVSSDKGLVAEDVIKAVAEAGFVATKL
jgi:copper chaperone CopZ